MSEAQDLLDLIAKTGLPADDQEALFGTVLHNRPGIGGLIMPSPKLITLDSHPVPGGETSKPEPVVNPELYRGQFGDILIVVTRVDHSHN